MSLIEKICKELGVEVGEIWRGNDGHDYYMNYHGQLCKVIYMDNPEEDEYYKQDRIERVLTGQLKPIWKPKEGDWYYMPHIDLVAVDLWDTKKWEDTPYENIIYKKGLVFQTQEEAIACAEKMIEVVKEE